MAKRSRSQPKTTRIRKPTVLKAIKKRTPKLPGNRARASFTRNY